MNNLDKILNFATQLEYHLYAYASKKDDLIENHPKIQEDINKLKDKYIKWLDLRFGKDSTYTETHPIEDCIPTLINYQNDESAISQKYNQNQEFKKDIDSRFPEKKWNNPADPTKMTIDEMEKIWVIFNKPSSKNLVEGLIEDTTDKSYKLPEEDKIGKVGPWNVWAPSSRENSCKIAGYDPITLEPFTTWCTARTEGSNLFYDYVGAGTILYYLIKDNPSGDNDWLSVGFMKGQPVFSSDGGISVNRANEGLTKKSLSSILGGYYDSIMEILKGKTDSLGGKSPAYIKIEEAASDINKYHSLLRGNTEKETIEIKLRIAKITTNEDILARLADDPQYVVRLTVADKTTNENILAILADDEDSEIRNIVAEKTANENILAQLANDKERFIRKIVAEKTTNEKTLSQLANDEHHDVRAAVAKNTTNEDILARLVKDKHNRVRKAVAKNTNNENILSQLVDDEDPEVRLILAKSTKNEKILTQLAGDEDYGVRAAAINRLQEFQRLQELLATPKIANLSKTVNLFYKIVQAISKSP